MGGILKENEDNRRYSLLLAMVVGVTNISQIPYLVDVSASRLISVPIWVILFLVCLFSGTIYFNNKALFPAICSSIILFITYILTLFTDNQYLNSPILYSYCLSIFIFFIGLWMGKRLSYSGLTYVINAYIIGAMIVALFIYYIYFRNGFNIMSSVYVYGSKNSVSQILFSALVFLFVVCMPRTKMLTIVKWGSIVFLGTLIMALKSRATIIGIVIMFILIMMYGNKAETITKKITIFVVFISVVMLVGNSNFYNILVNGILLVGNDSLDLAEISSGRLDQIVAFPELIKGNELFGTGTYDIESFPLNAWLQYGYFFGSIFILVSLWPIAFGFMNIKKQGTMGLAFLIIACSYWVNGLFEQLAPFGPGVKCFMLWLMLGLMSYKNKQNDDKTR